jgi:hypothetical protein
LLKLHTAHVRAIQEEIVISVSVNVGQFVLPAVLIDLLYVKSINILSTLKPLGGNAKKLVMASYFDMHQYYLITV